MASFRQRARFYLLFFLLFLVAAFVRFYRFPERINFGPEQADSLITAAKNISEKPSLLGQSYFARTTSTGHQLFASPLFSYSLIPLLLLFNYDPLPITIFFALLNLATGLALFVLGRRIVGRPAALLAVFFFLFSSRMISHSLFIWILNYLPLLGVLIVFLLRRLYFQRNGFSVLELGILAGIGVGMEYLFLPTAILILLIVLFLSRKKLKSIFLFLTGALAASLPTIIFDLKHSYYHLFTLWRYFLDVFTNPGQSRISYYHFLQFWPIMALMAGWIVAELWRKHKIVVALGIVLYLWLNLRSPQVSFSRAVGMADGFNYPLLVEAGQAIAAERPADFNVASLVPSDTVRAYPLRYLLTYRHKLAPAGVEDYQNKKSLFVIAPSDYRFGQSDVWEITASGRDSETKILKTLGEKYALYRLNFR